MRLCNLRRTAAQRGVDIYLLLLPSALTLLCVPGVHSIEAEKARDEELRLERQRDSSENEINCEGMCGWCLQLTHLKRYAPTNMSACSSPRWICLLPNPILFLCSFARC